MLWSLATRRDTRLAHARSRRATSLRSAAAFTLWSLATRRDTRLAHARSRRGDCFGRLIVRYAPCVARTGDGDRAVLTVVWVARELERACRELTLPQYRLLALIVRGEERA